MNHNTAIYAAIARNLRDFGYPDVSPDMIANVHTAMNDGKELPYGIVGMFAKKQLNELKDD